jgi:hypothetical protein
VIDFRYHVVSIVAVFLALALGLFIGSTTLRGKVGANISKRTENVTHENNKLRGELSDARSLLSRDEAFDNALTPYAVAGQLSGQSVVLVSAPGVDDGLRKRVTAALTLAGATLNGDIRLQDGLLDPQQDEFLKTLTDRVAAPGRPLPNGTGAQRALALLADVLGARPSDQPVSTAAAGRILSAYGDGKLLSVAGDSPHPASLGVLIAAPAPPSDDPDAAAQVALLGEFAHDLDRTAVGAVITGPAAADEAGGLLDLVRSNSSLRGDVSTVDSADLPSGVIATVMALAEQAMGRSGSYGSGSGADAPLPSPSPSP